MLRKSTQAFILGGVFFILPLLVVIILLTKGIHLLTPMGSKLVDLLGIEHVFGTATLSIICVALLLLICYCSGYLISHGLIRQWGGAVEEKMFLFFPSFQMLKYRMMGEQADHLEQRWQAALLKDNNAYRLAFITDQTEPDYISFFLPDAPRMDAGEIRYMSVEECEYVPISMQQAMNALNQFGRGLPLSELLSKPPQETKAGTQNLS